MEQKLYMINIQQPEETISVFKPHVFGMEKVWHRPLFWVGVGVYLLSNPDLYHFPKILKSEYLYMLYTNFLSFLFA